MGVGRENGGQLTVGSTAQTDGCDHAVGTLITARARSKTRQRWQRPQRRQPAQGRRARARASSAVMFAALAIREVVSTCDPPGCRTPPRPPALPPNIGDGAAPPDRAAAGAADALVLAMLAAASLGSSDARLGGAAHRRIPQCARSMRCAARHRPEMVEPPSARPADGAMRVCIVRRVLSLVAQCVDCNRRDERLRARRAERAARTVAAAAGQKRGWPFGLGAQSATHGQGHGECCRCGRLWVALSGGADGRDLERGALVGGGGAETLRQMHHACSHIGAVAGLGRGLSTCLREPNN